MSPNLNQSRVQSWKSKFIISCRADGQRCGFDQGCHFYLSLFSLLICDMALSILGYQTSKGNVSRFLPLSLASDRVIISVDEFVTTAAKALSHANALMRAQAKL